jgi:hypothetical protein
MASLPLFLLLIQLLLGLDGDPDTLTLSKICAAADTAHIVTSDVPRKQLADSDYAV